MRAAGLSGLVTRRKRGRRSASRASGSPNDLGGRDFSSAVPNRVWCADLKQIPTSEGVLYLGSVLHCFSRRIVGWSMRSDMKAELVRGALEMACARRRPEPGLVHHSDQSSQADSSGPRNASIRRVAMGAARCRASCGAASDAATTRRQQHADRYWFPSAASKTARGLSRSSWSTCSAARPCRRSRGAKCSSVWW